jgi:hypothetical protein
MNGKIWKNPTDLKLAQIGGGDYSRVV